MADWGILQPAPNFTQAALSGYQAGQQLGQQQRMRAALGGVDLERPETILPLLKEDPSTGAALYGAASKIADQRRATEARRAQADYVAAATKAQQPFAKASAPALSPVADPEMVSTPQPRGPDLNALRQRAIEADPDAFLQTQAAIDKMDEAQRKKLGEAQDALANVAQQASNVTYAQRRALIANNRQYLEQHGVTADQISGFDPTDQNVQMIIGQVLGVKGQLEQAAKARSEARAGRAEKRQDTALGIASRREARIAKDGVKLGDMSGDSTDALLKAAGL